MKYTRRPIILSWKLAIRAQICCVSLFVMSSVFRLIHREINEF